MRKKTDELYVSGQTELSKAKEANDQHYCKAKEFFENASKQQHAGARYLLGYLYLKGKVSPGAGCSSNLAYAAGHFYLASQQGHVLATISLAKMYEDGQIGNKLTEDERRQKVTDLLSMARSYSPVDTITQSKQVTVVTDQLSNKPSIDKFDRCRFFSRPDSKHDNYSAMALPRVTAGDFKEVQSLRQFLEAHEGKRHIPRGASKPMAITNAYGDCLYSATAVSVDPAVFGKNMEFRDHLRTRFNLPITSEADFNRFVDGLFSYDSANESSVKALQVLQNLSGNGFTVKHGLSNDLVQHLFLSYRGKVLTDDNYNYLGNIKPECQQAAMRTLAKSGLLYQTFMGIALRSFIASRGPSGVDVKYTSDGCDIPVLVEGVAANNTVGQYEESSVLGLLADTFNFDAKCLITEAQQCESYGPEASEGIPQVVIVRTGSLQDAHYSGIPQGRYPRCLTVETDIPTPAHCMPSSVRL